ncbi:hypothetical protein, partial [Actinocorallia lasiicapitis]
AETAGPGGRATEVRLPDGRVVWLVSAAPEQNLADAQPHAAAERPWRSPVYWVLVGLLFVLLGAHRFVSSRTPVLAGVAHGGREPSGGGLGGGGVEGQPGAVSYLDGDTGVVGAGGDGFLRAVLVELVTRGRGRVVLGRAELDRLFGGRLEARVLAALAPRMHVAERLADAVQYLELELLLEGDELHWFVAPGEDAGTVRALLGFERVHALILGPWDRTREVDPRGYLDGRLAPTLTSAEAAERLHLYTLTL